MQGRARVKQVIAVSVPAPIPPLHACKQTYITGTDNMATAPLEHDWKFRDASWRIDNLLATCSQLRFVLVAGLMGWGNEGVHDFGRRLRADNLSGEGDKVFLGPLV